MPPALSSSIPVAAGAVAGADIVDQGMAHAVGGIAKLVLESATSVRVNNQTALAIARRVNEMAAAIDPLLEHTDADDALGSFRTILAAIREELRTLSRRPYLAQLLHQQRDRDTLDALSSKMQDAYRILMVQLRSLTVETAYSLAAQVDSMPATHASPSNPLVSPELRRGAHLPPSPRLYFGRATETQLIVDAVLAAPARRVAILGAPGIGKTTLSLSVLHHPSVAARFSSDRYFVACDGAEAKQNCLGAVSESLGVSGSGSSVLKHKLKDLLGAQPALLVLDNFESAWEAASQRTDAEQLLQFLDSIEGLSVMVTLRGAERPSGLHWTRPFLSPLAPLSMAASKQLFVSVSDIDDSDPSTDTLLAHLDNVPLAVILMANLAQYESPAALLARWSELKTAMLLRGEGQDRQSSLDFSIRLSLESPRMRSVPEARNVLAALSLLPHGASDADMRLWATALSPHALRTLLQSSLATRTADHRVYVLAPIRSFMLAHYPPVDEDARQIYEHHFRAADLAKQSIQVASQPEIIMGLSMELANIESVARHALQHSRAYDRAAVQAAASLLFLYNEVYLGPGPDLLPVALTVSRERQYDELSADLLLRWGVAAFNGGMAGEPQALFREATELYERSGNDERAIASGLQLLHYSAPRDAVDGARRLYDRAAALRNYERMAHSSDELGRALKRVGKPVAALVHRERAIALFRHAVNHGAHERQLGYHQYRLAVEYHILGHLRRAGMLYQDALSVFERLKIGFGLTQARIRIADMFLDQGRAGDAITAVSGVLSANDTSSFRGFLYCLVSAVQAHSLLGNTTAATEALTRVYTCRSIDSLTAHEFVCVMLAHASVAWTSRDFFQMGDVLIPALARARSEDKVEPAEAMQQAEAHVLRALGEAALAQGDTDSAITLACTSSVIFALSHNKIDAVRSLVLLGESVDDPACAEPLLHAVDPAIDRMGLFYDHTKVLLQFAIMAHKRGQTGLAKQLATDATRGFESFPSDWRIEQALSIARGDY